MKFLIAAALLLSTAGVALAQQERDPMKEMDATNALVACNMGLGVGSGASHGSSCFFAIVVKYPGTGAAGIAAGQVRQVLAQKDLQASLPGSNDFDLGQLYPSRPIKPNKLRRR